MLISEEYMCEQKVDELKKLSQSGRGESNNELTCSVKDRELNE
jgi:hypothetical protein